MSFIILVKLVKDSAGYLLLVILQIFSHSNQQQGMKSKVECLSQGHSIARGLPLDLHFMNIHHLLSNKHEY